MRIAKKKGLLRHEDNQDMRIIKSIRIIIHSASADASAEIPENRFIKLKILLKHSGML